ncbi:MAG: hypothetical protein Q8904_01375 [Bacteroidota bacterium]|nr:hypothetical protein [Bacteroidota bacterium]
MSLNFDHLLTNCVDGIFLIDWVNLGEVIVDNCILKNNTTIAATSGGGAIGGPLWNSVNAGNRFNITNSQFIGNITTSSNGGTGMYIDAQGYPISISGCIFTGNVSNSEGGAVYLQNGNVTAATPATITNCVFAGNKLTTTNSSATGAAILKKTIKMVDCIVANNTCQTTNHSIIQL